MHDFKENGGRNLTATQREAAQHIMKIYDAAKKKLGGRYSYAFSDVYEFIAHAMTDSDFQASLSGLESRALAKYTAKGNLLSQFTQAISHMYDLVRKNFRDIFKRKDGTEEAKEYEEFKAAKGAGEGNYLNEMTEAFQKILYTPESGTDVGMLGASSQGAKGAAPKVAPKPEVGLMDKGGQIGRAHV